MRMRKLAMRILFGPGWRMVRLRTDGELEVIDKADQQVRKFVESTGAWKERTKA